jgi:hypothetical protein
MYGSYSPYDEYMASMAPAGNPRAGAVRSAMRYQRAAPGAAAEAAAPGPGVLGYGSLALSLLGTGMGAYGTYQAAKQAEREHELAVDAFNEERDFNRRQEARSEEQRQIGNTMGFANYARDLEQDVYGTYTPYSRSIGR